jgi:hypothetical protein
MLRFRDHWPGIVEAPLTAEEVRRLASSCLSPGQFVVGPGCCLVEEQCEGVEQRWELFRGRLLDPAHTRRVETFDEWNLFLVDGGERPPEPTLSIKLDAARGELHVVRAILCHVWEGYDAGGGVIESREATRWVRELVETIRLDEMRTNVELIDELSCAVFLAVVGTSRLPLTSVETPLPAFSLGRMGTSARPQAAAERAKYLEWLLHRTNREEIDTLRIDRPLETLTTMFNEASLSPWTDLVEKSLLLLNVLERQGRVTATEVIDFLASLIVQLGRHLTAYDLVTFHHRGANYPDALLLDLVLKEYLRRIESTPAPFDESRLRRRALRQGWLLRRYYEGLPVPDAPTSPGENQRVLPPPHVRVPEEQILHPHKRRRLLYADDPLPRHCGPHGERILRRSLDDLAHPTELCEMGLALFLDRPLGVTKQPGEPDQTILLSHRAFSRSIARRRVRMMAEKLGLPVDLGRCEAGLEALTLKGVALGEIGGRSRPGAVSVADAHQVAEDFLFLRTTPGTVAELFEQYDFSPDTGVRAMPLLIVPRQNGVLGIHDAEMRTVLELTPDVSEGYVRRAGREMLRAGLRAGERKMMPRVNLLP